MKKGNKYSLMPTHDKAQAVYTWLEENKAHSLTVLEVKTPVTDVVVIASATSLRHAKSLADGLSKYCRQENFELLSSEGYQSAQWILVDMNDIVVHIFQEDNRALYQLENLWSEAQPLILNSRGNSSK